MKINPFQKKLLIMCYVLSRSNNLCCKDFLNDDECKAFIEAASGKLKHSTVISAEKHIHTPKQNF